MSWLDSLLGAIPFVSQSGGGKLQPDPFAGLNVIGATLAKNAATGNVDMTIPTSSAGGQGNSLLTSGLNSNITPAAGIVQRVYGPVAAFSVGGWNDTPSPGQERTIINTTTQPMTVLNEDVSTGAAGRIDTQSSGAPIVLQPKVGSVVCKYDASDPGGGGAAGRWVVQNVGIHRPETFNVQNYGAKGDGTTDDTTAINAADAAAQVAGGTVYLPPGTYVCTTITLHGLFSPEQGAILSPSVVANIYGPVVAAPTQQIFSSTAVVSFFNQSAAAACYVHEVWAAWWGAKGDWAGGTSGTDNTNAFRYALRAAMALGKQSSGATGGKLRLGRGQFRVTDTPFTVLGDSTDNVGTWGASRTYHAVPTQFDDASVTHGSTAITFFNAETIAAGVPFQFFSQLGVDYVLASPITSSTSGTLSTAYTGPSNGGTVVMWSCCVVPSTPNGYFYGCAVAGTTGGSPPVWPTVVGATVQDGTVVWRCLGVLQPGVTGASGVIIKGENTSGQQPTNTLIACDFSGDPSGSTGSVTDAGVFTDSSHTFTAADVGQFIYISSSATASNVGAWRISTYNSAHSVTLTDPTGEYTFTTDAGGAIAWVQPRRSCVRFWSRDNVANGFVVIPADNRSVYSAVDDTIPPLQLSICSNNEFSDIVATGNRGGAILMHGLTHADNPITPNANTAFGDCENTRYPNSSALDCAFANFYDPNNSGQSKDILFERTTLASADVLTKNPRVCYYKTQGSAVFKETPVGYSHLGFYTGQSFLIVENIESEGLERVLSQPSNNQNSVALTFIGGRIAVNRIAADGTHMIVRGCAMLNLLGVMWDGVYTSNFNIKIDNHGTGHIEPVAVTAIGCNFPSMTPVLASGQYKINLKNCNGVISDGGTGAAYPIANAETTSAGTTSTATTSVLEEVTTLPGTQVTIRFRVSSRDTSSFSAANSAVQEIVGSFVNVAGTVTQVGSTQTAFTKQGSADIGAADFNISGVIVRCRITQASGTDTWDHVARAETEVNF